MRELVLSFNPTLDNAQWATIAVRQVVTALLDSTDVNLTEDRDTFLSAIELAAGEACCNAVKHGPDNGADKIKVSISLNNTESKLTVAVSDGNPAYDFSEREPDFEAMAESGYGIHIMRTLMDKVAYRRDKGRNIVIMEKQIQQGDER